MSGHKEHTWFWQGVTIPADAQAVTLNFWYRVFTYEETFDSDSLCYGMWDPARQTNYVKRCIDLHIFLGLQPRWREITVILSADELASVAGQTVALAFNFTTGPLGWSEVWVDDTALYVTTPDATPTPTGPTPTPLPTGGPFRIILAWTDYPGEPAAAKALVNDLDLEVIAPNGNHYYGNQGLYTSGQCLRGGQWDACNNVEGVIIPDAPHGAYRVVVRGVNVPQGPQPFALAASYDGAGSGSPGFVYLPLVVRNE